MKEKHGSGSERPLVLLDTGKGLEVSCALKTQDGEEGKKKRPLLDEVVVFMTWCFSRYEVVTFVYILVAFVASNLIKGLVVAESIVIPFS